MGMSREGNVQRESRKQVESAFIGHLVNMYMG